MFGGKIPVEAYRGMDESYASVSIGAGKTFEVKIEVTKDNTEVVYDFVTEEHDLGMAVFYQADPADDKKREVIQPMKRYASRYHYEKKKINNNNCWTIQLGKHQRRRRCWKARHICGRV